MPFQFYINEESGEKLYKLINIKISQKGVMKIISKESNKGRIHFIIRLSSIDPDTEEILSEETKYKSTEKGVTKRQFNNMVDAMISKLPENAEVKIHDMSHYSSLKDQFSTGVMDGFFNIRTKQSNEWH
ncbi:MAG: hypothetical protein IBX72_11395 [Nitrospirae bacterium]|nr:hypothetical protein [Nitrospirota bacterium]